MIEIRHHRVLSDTLVITISERDTFNKTNVFLGALLLEIEHSGIKLNHPYIARRIITVGIGYCQEL